MEKEIKDHLENRTIEPSRHLWAELENALDKAEVSSHRKFWWMGIAASFLIGGCLAYYALTLSNSPAPLYKESNLKINALTASSVESAIQSKKMEIEPVLSIKNSKETHQSDQSTSSKRKVHQEAVSIASNIEPKTVENLEKTALPKQLIEVKKTAQNTKDHSVDVAVKDSKTTQASEVDLLLKQAQKKIAYTDVIDEQKNNVNAEMLLHETHLKQSNSVNDFLKKTIENRLKVVANKN